MAEATPASAEAIIVRTEAATRSSTSAGDGASDVLALRVARGEGCAEDRPPVGLKVIRMSRNRSILVVAALLGASLASACGGTIAGVSVDGGAPVAIDTLSDGFAVYSRASVDTKAGGAPTLVVSRANARAYDGSFNLSPDGTKIVYAQNATGKTMAGVFVAPVP